MINVMIPTHKLGVWFINIIDSILDKFGLSHEKTVETIIYVTIISAFAIFIGWLLRRIILFVSQKAVALKRSDFGNELLEQKVLTKCSHIIPPLVILAMIPLAFESDPKTISIINRWVVVYLLIAIGYAINTVLTFIWIHFDTHENTNKHPLRGLLNTGHGIVWIIIFISALSVVIDKSPATLLAGLGAFAAALMLIFKDSILGFVAGIQLSQNDMLRVGDWIVVPSTIANGTVETVTLTVVKVRNWDNTLVMLPPYTLISSSFQNWRGMSETGARRISRSFYVDNSSIVTVDSEFVDSIVAKYPEMKEFVDSVRKRLADGEGNAYNTGISPVNGTLDTNLGLFRGFLTVYLHHHPAIDKNQYLMARVLDGNEYGTPIQIYCFSKIIDWVAYEAVQSEIVEHIAAVANDFNLVLYNAPDRNRFTVDTTRQPAPISQESTAQPETPASSDAPQA